MSLSPPPPPRLLRLLAFPYALLLFAPFAALWTALWGLAGMLLAPLSARLAFQVRLPWGWGLCLAAGCWPRVRGLEHLDPRRSYVLMANHQSHMDVPAVLAVWRGQFRFVIKQELRKVPFLGWYAALGGHVFVDRRDRQRAIASLEEAERRLEPGISIFFFPEGTRSPDGRLQPFKKGGFVMARKLGLPVLPMSIRGTAGLLPARTPWLLPGRRVEVVLHPPVDPHDFPGEELEPFMEAVRVRIAAGLEGRGPRSG